MINIRGKTIITLSILLVSLALLSSQVMGQTSNSSLSIDSVEFVRWIPQKSPNNHQIKALSQNRRDELIRLGNGIVALEFFSTVRFNKNGTIRENVIHSTQYLSESGIQSNGNFEISVNAYNETIEFLEAEVIFPNGRSVTVNSETIQILTETRENVFTDSYRIIIPWPSLTPGAITRLQYTSITQTANVTMPWTRLYFPQSLHAIEHFHVDVLWEEADLKPNWATDFQELTCDAEKSSHITCEGKKIRPYKTDPNIRYIDVLPTLIFAQPSSWKRINEKLLSIFNAAQSRGPTIQHQLNQILELSSSEEEKLASIYAFVSRDIRYVALSKGNRGIIPHDSSTTLSRRFGDCKDKTVLFLDLAHMANIDAFPVLTSSYRQSLDKISIPSTAYFDHMIACGNLKSGKKYCVDLTNPYSSHATLPYNIQGAVSLKLIGPHSKPDRLPISRNQWINRVNTQFSIDKSGNLLEVQKRIYESEYAAQLRSFLRGLGDQNLLKWATNDYHEKRTDRIDPTFRFDGINNQEGPVTIESTAKYTNFSDPSTPLNLSEYKNWLNYLAALFNTRNKHHPFNFPGFLYEAVDHFELKNNQEFKNLGADLNFSSEFGIMQRTYMRSKNTVVVTTLVDLPQSTIPLSQIPRFNRFLKLIKHQSFIRLFITPQQTK